jgi:hypothetical protein
VYFFGIGAPGANAGLDTVNAEPESMNAARNVSRITCGIVPRGTSLV